MLKYGNRDFRNLQEQVYANMRNIEDIIKGSDVMADYTLNIVGQVDETAELPDADTYEGKLGDIYVVGESSPFHCYVFAKVYENENAPSWIDLGAIFVQGPQGIQGEQGPAGADGTDGQDGAAGGFGTPTASASSVAAGSDPTVSVTASGPDTAKIFAFSFGIPEGAKGDDGDSATITVGSTTTGAAGTNASVTNSGTSSAAVLNFTIPKGDTGLGVPEIQSGDAGKVLLVNAGETAAEWGTDNSLKLPESAPAAQQLVGINTSGEQNALNIGAGLLLDGVEIKNKEVLTITAEFASTASSGTISISADLAAEIAANLPIIKLVYSDNVCAYLLKIAVSGTNLIYQGLLDANTTQGNNLLYGTDGNPISASTYRRIKLEVISTGSLSYSRSTVYMAADTNGSVGLNFGATNISVTSGSTISASNRQKLLTAGVICKINNVYAYPVYIDSSEIRYFSIDRDSSGNFVQTIYVINKSTWVITFYTKTIQ